ncbi:hypothetical protein CerSpe_121670 [Prunus speciosa]
MEKVLNHFATKFALTEEEEIELDLGGSLFDGVAFDLYFLVGKLLTENVNKVVFIGTMKKIWCLNDGVSISNVNANRFLFTFSCESNKQQVLHGSPWTFDKALLMLTDDDGLCNATTVPLTTQDFWVQAHDLHVLYMNPVVGELIGRSLGGYIEIEQSSTGLCMGSFLRIRVRLDVTKALRRVLKI